jgi:hypothetical protein
MAEVWFMRLLTLRVPCHSFGRVLQVLISWQVFYYVCIKPHRNQFRTRCELPVGAEGRVFNCPRLLGDNELLGRHVLNPDLTELLNLADLHIVDKDSAPSLAQA